MTDINIVFLIALFLAVIFIRLTQGGIGLETFADYAIPILAIIFAIKEDQRMFLTRLVKVCMFLAVASLMGYMIGIVAPSLFRNFFLSFKTGWGVSTWTSAVDYATRYYTGYGVFLFSWIDRMGLPNRNIGFYTEPGVYQIVLNTVLFILLFLRKHLELSDKKVRKYVILTIITLISCQSTSGLLGILVIIICSVLTNQKETEKQRYRMIILLLIGIALLIADYNIRIEDSILSKVVLKKLFSDNMDFSLSASSSGAARIGTIFVCLQAMFQHPFGMGTTALSTLLTSVSTDYVAGALLSFGASLGVIPLAITLLWVFAPFKKSGLPKWAVIAYIFMYFNVTLSQSSAFYPMLIVIPMWLRYKKNMLLDNEV
ncbi:MULTISPECIES: hypothetical protein [Clostridia]|uniref:hypothetical protein n=1 Tax=Clostridia TaxID=186801 RepID=UPI0011C228DC|nr:MULTISPECIES: hypothetical protein [Clostridia]